MRNLSTISSRIHINSATDTTRNTTRKLKAFQAMVQGDVCRIHQFCPRFGFDHIAVDTDVSQAIKHNHKARNPPISDNDIGGIAKDHPRNFLFVGKVYNAF